MKTRLIIDEDSVYEIDEECIRRKREKEEKKQEKRNGIKYGEKKGPQ